MADEKDLVDQSEIEKLLSQGPPAGASPPAADKTPAGEETPAPEEGGETTGDAPLGQGEIEALMGGAASAEEKPAESEEIADADKLLGQEDIEKLLSQAGKSSGPPPPPSTAAAAAVKPAAAAPAAAAPADGESMAQDDIEYLLNQAERALESAAGDSSELPDNVVSFQLPEFSGAPANTDKATLDLINDVELDLRIELGRTSMYLEDVLKLRKGSVVPLDKLAGDPVDIYVNGRLVASGEVLVLNDNFCVRVAELVAGASPGMD